MGQVRVEPLGHAQVHDCVVHSTAVHEGVPWDDGPRTEPTLHTRGYRHNNREREREMVYETERELESLERVRV